MSNESSSREEMALFSPGAAATLAAGDPAASSPPASIGECGEHCSHSARVVGPSGSSTASAVALTALSVAVYKSVRMQTSSLLRQWKQFLRAAIMASANLVATPSFITAAISLEVVKPAPLNASLLSAETVLTVNLLGLINWFEVAEAREGSREQTDMVIIN